MRIAPNIQVFHDGDCPVCELEIRFYGSIDKADRIRWTDVTGLRDAELPAGKTRSELLGRFHVRELPARNQVLPDSAASHTDEWFIGVDAFARIWRELPVFKWFVWIFSVPGIRQLAQLAYLGFLRWQARHRAKRQRASQPAE